VKVPIWRFRTPFQHFNLRSFLKPLTKCSQTTEMRVFRFGSGTAPLGERWTTPKFTLVLCNPEAFHRLFESPSELSIGEAYIAGDFDVEGDMEAAFEFGDYLLSRKRTHGVSQVLVTLVRKMPVRERAENHSLRFYGPAHSKKRDSLSDSLPL